MTQPCRTRCLAAFVAAIAALVFPCATRAGTWVPFGPKTYTRGTGAPVTVTDTFTVLNPATQYTLKAFNGGLQDDTTELVSNCVVLLNGVQVIGPGNFDRNVAELDVPISPGFTNALSVQVRGKPGGVLVIEILGVDNDPPNITANLSPSPNAAGWNNSPVTVTFTCSDKTSGVASCPSPVTVSAEGANQFVSGTATDLAGNTASTSATVNLDMTPPTITGAINPPPDAGGYNSSAVTVSFTCADALSGVASCSPPVAVTGEVTGYVVPGTATDVAGNTATASVTVNISFKYFKIRSWQTNPSGDPLQTGKCLDYGASPSGNGATVFLNDCSAAHPIRVVEIAPRDQKDARGYAIPLCYTQDSPLPNPPTPHTLCHEVMLFAGKTVIGIHNPPVNMLGGSPSPGSSPTEYSLELQLPWNSTLGRDISSPANQIFRLDGDSIILEGNSIEPGTGANVPGPCINAATSTTLCPPPPPQLVIQIQNARGANGSPIVASARNLSDNEFWDFNALDGSGRYPTTGFMPVATNFDLWNAICAGTSPISSINQAPAGSCLGGTNLGWGSVVVITNSDPNECKNQPPEVGPCIDLSGDLSGDLSVDSSGNPIGYPPLMIPAGVTLRGDRRGTSFGPQLFAHYTIARESLHCNGVCMLGVQGDYARVTGLRLRGPSRSFDKVSSDLRVNDGIVIEFAGVYPLPPPPSTPSELASITQFIASIDHNDASDWEDAAVSAHAPFTNDAGVSGKCNYIGYVDGMNRLDYNCDQNFPLAPNVPFPPSFGLPDVPIAEDPINPPGPGTLANMHVARNFLHHNLRDDGGYGVGVQGRALVEGNTFVWNRHDISANGDPHYEYRASHNLILSSAHDYGGLGTKGRLQDFDMHGTLDANDAGLFGGLFLGGVGGYYVEIDGNTFLGASGPFGGGGHDYVLRGFPVHNSNFHGNVSLRNIKDAVHFFYCDNLTNCINDYTAGTFPIDNVASSNQFADTSHYTNPTAQLGVGDFDGDGTDDLFLATGAAWYYSPGGQREWRFLSAKTDRIDGLLFGDFDGDGRTDVVGINPSGYLVVSWGGISDWELLNPNPLTCTSTADMAVGKFLDHPAGDRRDDILCADGLTWTLSYGGSEPFNFALAQPNSFRVKDLRFGDFNGQGKTDVFSVGNNGWQISYAQSGFPALSNWIPLPISLTKTIDGLIVADFNGDGMADVAMSCTSGGIFGLFGSPGWQISYGATQGWSNCNTYDSSFSVVGGGVGRFSGGQGADILLWDKSNGIDVFRSGTGPSGPLSTQDMR